MTHRRIAEKGHLLDKFPNLRFKAYLTARSGDGTQSRENLYAPFYLWNHEDGLNDFLCGEGFVGVTRSFGWPMVRTWFVWQAHLSSVIGQQRSQHVNCGSQRLIHRSETYASVTATKPCMMLRRAVLWPLFRHSKRRAGRAFEFNFGASRGH
ncbi:DUF4865 family protein [Phyllobacterium brassicacearum]|uniref:DUF4865 family protein n=1 Tax=Phyllobacterium brassicacearum TaxID=314235 RepID=UPI003CCA26F4